MAGVRLLSLFNHPYAAVVYQHPQAGNWIDVVFQGEDGSEVTAGTNPLSAASIFQVLSISRSPEGVTMRWSSVEGRNYRILHTDSLDQENSWQEVATVPGADIETSFTDPDVVRAASGEDYFRVEVIPLAQ